jgi:(p)ppGpp synthase/HD superfamily hydrolase
MRTENWSLAYELKLAIDALRELLRRYERSRAGERRLLHWYIGAPYMREDEFRERLVALNLPVGPISRALRIARQAHGDQRRDDGAFYLEEHIYPVAYEVARYQHMHQLPGPLTSTLVAILRDSMEDSDDPSSVRGWIEAELGDDVGRFVERLTKPPKSEFAHLSEAEAKEAREAAYMDVVRQLPAHIKLVKVIDRINNLLCVHKSPSKIEGYVQETIRYHLPLAASVDSELVEQMGFLIEVLERRLEMDDLLADDR